MSIRAMTAVWERSRMKGGPLLLLLAIADHANDHGRDAYRSTEPLSRKVRMSRRQVQRMITLLEDADELRRSVGTGPRGTNEYIVVAATGDKMSPRQDVAPHDVAVSQVSDKMSQRQDVAPAGNVAEGVTELRQGGDDVAVSRGGRHSCVTRTVPEPSKEPSLIRPAAAAAAGSGDKIRRVLDGEELEAATVRCIRSWERATGMTVTAQTGDALATWLEKLPEAALVKAIAETGASSSRSWRYCEAILRRYEVEGWDDDERRETNSVDEFRAGAARLAEIRRQAEARGVA